MKLIVFNGSPAGKVGSTHVMTEAFLRGAELAGAETETVFLAEKEIEYCTGCFACWFKTPGRCGKQDDMQDLLERYRRADIVCFATPVYTWNMTANLKAFVDRLAPLKSPLITQQGGRCDLADTEEKGQKFVVLSNCGFPGNHNFEIMKAVMAPCKPVLEIYRNCGRLLKSQDEKIREKVEEYLRFVEKAGFELTAKGEVTEETKEGLERELLSVSEYIAYLGM